MTERQTLSTSRLTLVAATPALIDEELARPERLADELAADLAVDWPPEDHDGDALRFFREKLQHDDAAGWWLYYVLVTRAPRPLIVGSAGFKGPPEAGVVEIGYSIVLSQRRRGFATEACRALVEAAWRGGADAVSAQTLPGNEPSIGVLRKLGFTQHGARPSGMLAFELRRFPV